MNKKNVKITKQTHPFKGYASSYIVWISNYFKLELQLTDAESAIKSKLIQLLTQIKTFKFVTTLVLAFNLVKIKQGITIFIQA